MDIQQSDFSQESISIIAMNIYTRIFTAVLGLSMLSFLSVSCGLDNYDAPSNLLHGKIVYEGRPVCLRSTSGAVQLQLYQDGYAKRDPIAVYVDQNGEFSARLFTGDYKLVTRDGNGPWVNSRDTLEVHVDGPTECVLEVEPYYLFGQYDFSLQGSTVKASATIEQIVADASVDKAILVVGKTRFVDESVNLKQITLTLKGDMTVQAEINMSSVSSYEDSMHLFARIGVRAAGADQYVFTPVVQLQ